MPVLTADDRQHTLMVAESSVGIVEVATSIEPDVWFCAVAALGTIAGQAKRAERR